METFSGFLQKGIGDFVVFLYINFRISPTQKQSMAVLFLHILIQNIFLLYFIILSSDSFK